MAERAVDDASVFDDEVGARLVRLDLLRHRDRGQTDLPQPCHMVALELPGRTTERLSLAAANVDAGAAAILNIGHWFSFTGEAAHNAGNNSFTYKRFDGWKAAKYVPYHDLFIRGDRHRVGARLSGETEWTYDRSTNTVRLILKADNGDPSTVDLSGVRVQARAQEYAIAMRGCTHAEVRGLRMFATTVFAAGEKTCQNGCGPTDIQNVQLASLVLVHPSAGKRILNDFGSRRRRYAARQPPNNPVANLTLWNCSFYGAGATRSSTPAARACDENNLITWNDWTAVTTRAKASSAAATRRITTRA